MTCYSIQSKSFVAVKWFEFISIMAIRGRRVKLPREKTAATMTQLELRALDTTREYIKSISRLCRECWSKACKILKIREISRSKKQQFWLVFGLLNRHKWNFSHFLQHFMSTRLLKLFSANLIIGECPHEGSKVGFWCTNLLNVNDAIFAFEASALKWQENAGNKVKAVKIFSCIN